MRVALMCIATPTRAKGQQHPHEKIQLQPWQFAYAKKQQYQVLQAANREKDLQVAKNIAYLHFAFCSLHMSHFNLACLLFAYAKKRVCVRLRILDELGYATRRKSCITATFKKYDINQLQHQKLHICKKQGYQVPKLQVAKNGKFANQFGNKKIVLLWAQHHVHVPGPALRQIKLVQ